MYDPSLAHQVRRATTATSILDVAAHVGLFVGMIFWSLFFFTLIAPVDLVEAILAVALAAGYTVVLPMLISLLAPSTPAGMLLAETRWKTFGHALSVAATLFMSYHAFMMLWSWWAARPTVLATGQDIFLAIGTAIIFIVVPALSWVQTAPDRWVAEVIQARQVQRLKAAQQANIMAAQVQYARALALLKRGLANATAAERAELASTLIAMQRAENEAIGQVADQLRILTGIDGGVSLLDGPELQQQYEQLSTQVERLIAPVHEADYVAFAPAPTAAAAPPPVPASFRREAPPPAAEGRGAHQDAIPALAPPLAAAAAAPSAAASRSESRRYAAEFRAVAAAFPAPAVFGARQVAETVGKSERTARDMITTWKDAGWVARGEAANSYYITEG